MIGWLQPAALAGLALLGLPVLVHLLRTHRAERILFPTLRFVAPSRTAAVRLRLPADWLLLLLRLAIVASAAVAMGQPVIVTAARLRAWNARTVRAVVLDTSPAMEVSDAAGTRPLDVARRAADAEAGGAAQSVRIESARLGDAVVQAAQWLATTPPARRELVVISSFPEGALRERDVAAVPAGVGLRLMPVGTGVDTRRIAGASLFAAPGAAPQAQQVLLTGPRTGVTLTATASTQAGWRVIDADPTSAAVQRLSRAVASAGAPAPSATQPMAVEFGPAADASTVTPIGPGTPRWMLRTLVRLQSDDALRRASSAATASSLTAADRWMVVATARDGNVLVRIAARQDELVMQVGAPADSFMAAAAVRALLVARAGDTSRPDQEILRLPPAVLTAWSRPAPPVERDVWRHADASDARWFWLLALLLLGVEHRLRRSVATLPIEVRDAA